MLVRILIIYILISFALPLGVKALSINNPSANYYLNSSHNFNITAQFSEDNIYAVRIKLTLSNATITNFVPSGGWLATIGECAGAAIYNSTQVCVSLAKASEMTSGEALGTLSITFNNLGAVTLTQEATNGYSDGGIFYPYTGVLKSINVVNEPEEPPIDEEEPPVDEEEPPVDEEEPPTNGGNTGNNGGSNNGNNGGTPIPTDDEDEEESPVSTPIETPEEEDVDTSISGSNPLPSSNNANALSDNLLKVILGVNIVLISGTLFLLYKTLRS